MNQIRKARLASGAKALMFGAPGAARLKPCLTQKYLWDGF